MGLTDQYCRFCGTSETYEGSAEAENVDELTLFLRRVAARRNIRQRNVDSWVDAVERKLNLINIVTVEAVVENIMSINQRLLNMRRNQFHLQTLDAMAREGVRELTAERHQENLEDIIEEDHDIAAVAKTSEKDSKITSSTFLGDSGASTHMGNSDEGMYDVTIISSPVKIGNGITLTATKIGKRNMTAM